MEALHALGGEGTRPFSPEVDETALLAARKIAQRLGDDMKIRLTPEEWIRFAAIIQAELIPVIRHAAFDKPEYPGDQAVDEAYRGPRDWRVHGGQHP